MNDRMAEIVDRLRVRAQLGVNLDDDQEANVLVDELTLDERKEVMALVEQKLAHGWEIMEAELATLEAQKAAVEVRKHLDRGEIDRQEAERRVGDIDRASGGAVSRLWKLD